MLMKLYSTQRIIPKTRKTHHVYMHTHIDPKNIFNVQVKQYTKWLFCMLDKLKRTMNITIDLQFLGGWLFINDIDALFVLT